MKRVFDQIAGLNEFKIAPGKMFASSKPAPIQETSSDSWKEPSFYFWDQSLAFRIEIYRRFIKGQKLEWFWPLYLPHFEEHDVFCRNIQSSFLKKADAICELLHGGSVNEAEVQFKLLLRPRKDWGGDWDWKSNWLHLTYTCDYFTDHLILKLVEKYDHLCKEYAQMEIKHLCAVLHEAGNLPLNVVQDLINNHLLLDCVLE
jgi:hypothetical protein